MTCSLFARRCARIQWVVQCVCVCACEFYRPHWINTSAPSSIRMAKWKAKNMKNDCFSTHFALVQAARAQKWVSVALSCRALCTLLLCMMFVYHRNARLVSYLRPFAPRRMQNDERNMVVAIAESAWACVYFWFYYNYSIRRDEGRVKGVYNIFHALT